MALMIGVNEEGRVVGESHPKCKLSDHDVDLIRILREDYSLGYKEIADKFEVAVSTVFDICNYNIRCQVPVKWVRAKKKRIA